MYAGDVFSYFGPLAWGEFEKRCKRILKVPSEGALSTFQSIHTYIPSIWEGSLHDSGQIMVVWVVLSGHLI
jgi:hypothetical protein